MKNKSVSPLFTLSGVVIHGKALGRTLGFPTANIRIGSSETPEKGVYASLVYIGNEKHMGVTNIGVRPSVTCNDDHIINCETHILGFEDDIYGQTVKVELYKKLRDEKKFSSLEELTSAVMDNIRETAEFFEM